MVLKQPKSAEQVAEGVLLSFVLKVGRLTSSARSLRSKERKSSIGGLPEKD
jgi:hypothetical protein